MVRKVSSKYARWFISGGQAKTLMFVHISPETDAIGETISTLKFAERVATVELGAARVNKDSADVKELKEQVLILLVIIIGKCTTSVISSLTFGLLYRLPSLRPRWQ